ncbi:MULTISPECIES: protein kinase domain-containing protein [Nostoc]|uniref:non-specific serine/threonine protein kinase n=1 Tax=Nostoc paludosum FACHB-159 TaxID=2692908 RepID=A0ABR8KP68_9NOSO|nr:MULTISPECIES: serine/threonine-protein kinase [Nostoc]MBD2683215.1 protein kinase [Nostoc sp. FACHB-857]MBD2739542.1 protein kinase [Nostoc paludosum FACHB-159]
MIYCINPLCEQRQNPDNVERCLCCGTSLLINDRIRLLKPLRELTENPFTRNEIFEVDDAGTKWNPVDKRRVMKVLKWSSPELVQLIERESLALQLIQHPNTPESNTLDDLFTFVPNNSHLTLHCLVMDKFEGQNLEEWIKSHEPISQSLALEWLRQLVEILDVVHRTEFFHRDIKPANIILQPNWQLALIDFGTARRITDTYLAKVSGSGGTETRIGNYEITSVVSHYYTPLEQVHGKAVPQSDFYALGRTFVRLVTGTPLMRLPTDQKTGNLIWRNKAQQIDKPLADFLDELMAPVPGQRPATTEVILQRLKILPRQSKVYRVTRSKTFISGVLIASASLITLGIYKIGLPAYAKNLVAEGQKLEAANNSQKAQSYFDQAVKIRPELSVQISQFYFDKAGRTKDDLNSEKKYYSLAIKYNPKDVDSYNNLAVACQLLQDIDCVTKAYEELFKLKPNIWEGHYNLGNFYETQNKYDLAEKQYRLAIQYSNNQATNAVNNLSRLKNLQGKYSEAAQLAIEGLNNTPDSYNQWRAALYKNLGWSRLMQKDYSEADKYLQKAFELDSQRVDVYCLLAKTKEALEQLDYASSYWEMCLLARTDREYLPEIQKWREEVLSRIFKKN